MQFQTTRSFILASASPRRKELFGRLNIPFEIVTADVEETSVQASEVSQYVTEVALLKARAVAKKSQGKVVIGADTIVAKDNQLLHKPKSHDEAMAHLRTLRNTAHEVLTAVAIIEEDGTESTLVEKRQSFLKMFLMHC